MNKDLIRIGTDKFVNESTLAKQPAFDLLFSGFHEFVYVPDDVAWVFVNGTWTGSLGLLMNDIQWIGSYQTK